jgi:hypothetical protein
MQAILSPGEWMFKVTIHTLFPSKIVIMRAATPNLGPLTGKIVSAAGWASSNPKCPPSQKWAEEFERVFSFADYRGQYHKYFNRLTSKSYSQFDSSLAELRVAYYLDRTGFPTVTWEPIPKSGNAGEFIVACPSGERVFAEVKSPGWESELEPYELKAGRATQEKYRHNEGRSVAPHAAIQFAIRKAYKKFDPASRNLLVIVDDLFVRLENSPEKFAQWALYGAGGYFTSSAYENLGGVGIFWVDQDTVALSYTMKLFLNQNALSAATIPEEMVARLH